MSKEPITKETLPTTYNDSRFSYTLQHEDGCKVKVNVSLSKEFTQECYQAGFKNVKKHFSVPGFRKGRVPDSVIHERCGRQITEEYHRCITDTFFDTVLPVCKIYPHGQCVPKITALKPSKEEGATYQIEYETTADVPEVQPEELVVKEITTTAVDPDEIEKLYKKIAIRQGKKTQVTDRPIQEDDLVTVQYSHIDPENPQEEDEEDQREMTLYLNEITKDAQWLTPVLLGKNLNETVTCPMPNSPENEENPYLLKMHITNIETCESATDEEISEHFKGESKENIYKALEADLLKEIHKKEFDQKRRTVEEALLKTLPFDLPSSVVQKAAQKEIEHQQRTREDSTPLPTEEMEQLFKAYQGLLNAQWKIDLLLSSFIEKESIEPSVQEITKAMLDIYLNEATFGNYLANPEGFQNEIREKLKHRMAIEIIYERAQKENA